MITINVSIEEPADLATVKRIAAEMVCLLNDRKMTVRSGFVTQSECIDLVGNAHYPAGKFEVAASLIASELASEKSFDREETVALPRGNVPDPLA